MAGEPRVRPATVDDADAIALVHVETWQTAYRGQVPDRVLEALSVDRRAERWKEWLPDQARAPTWVAEQDGRVVGFVNAGPSRDPDAGPQTGEINAIYVRPGCWDRGVGAALMGEATAWMRERFTEATLWVLETNARGRRFYELGGWSADGTSQPLDFDGTPITEVRYRIGL